MEDTKRKGDVSEQKVITKLLEIGVDVFTPVGENTRSDLIYELNGIMSRVQVKTGRYTNGCIAFNCKKVHSNSTENVITTYENDVEEFIVYSRKTDKFYIIPIDEIGSSEMKLRFETSESPYANYTNSNWAEDYLLENEDDLLVGIE